MSQLSTSPGESLELLALTDSGAGESFVEPGKATSILLPCFAHGHLLSQVAYQTPSISMFILSNHCETISFLIIDSPQFLLILGYPWLCIPDFQFDLLV